MDTAKKAILYLENAIATVSSCSHEHQTFTGCIYDSDGRLIKATQRAGEDAWGPADPQTINPHCSRVLSGKSVYLGNFFPHYGHFLLESTSRLWVLQIKKFDNFVFHTFQSEEKPPLDVIKACLDCFKINPKQLVVLDVQTQFEQLWVPSSLYTINTCASSEQMNTYRELSKFCRSKSKNEEKPLRLYLSRRKLKHNKRISNEQDIEKLFRRYGFRIMYPESVQFEAAVSLYYRTEILAGIYGSAVHNSVFMRSGGETITIGFPNLPNTQNFNQIVCDRMSGMKSNYIQFKGNDSQIDIDWLKLNLESILNGD